MCSNATTRPFDGGNNQVEGDEQTNRFLSVYVQVSSY